MSKFAGIALGVGLGAAALFHSGTAAAGPVVVVGVAPPVIAYGPGPVAYYYGSPYYYRRPPYYYRGYDHDDWRGRHWRGEWHRDWHERGWDRR